MSDVDIEFLLPRLSDVVQVARVDAGKADDVRAVMRATPGITLLEDASDAFLEALAQAAANRDEGRGVQT